MRFTARLAAAILATVPLAAAVPQELTANSREFCKTEPSDALLALHEKIVNEDEPTMQRLAQGEAFIQNALAKGDSGLHGRSESIQVTRRESGELITLDAWFHVVYNQNSTAGGYIQVRSRRRQSR